MKHFSKMMLLALGFGLSAAVLGLIPSRPVGAHDPGLPPLDVNVVNTPTVTMPTHLGAQPSDLVTLQCTSFTTGNRCDRFSRIAPDGTLDFSAFTIPDGEGLVITDIDAAADFQGVAAGTLEVFLVAATLGGPQVLVHVPALTAPTCGAGCSTAVFTAHLTAGLHFTVVPGATVPAGGSAKEVRLLGYLVVE